MKKMIAAAFAAMGLIAAVGAFAPADADPISVADKYVVVDGGPAVYEENGSCEGLQQETTYDEDGNVVCEGDTRLA